VSRLLCSPEIPPTSCNISEARQQHKALRQTRRSITLLATTRRGAWPKLLRWPSTIACSLRPWPQGGSARQRIAGFKRLAIAAIGRVAKGQPGFGTLLDDTYGREAMFDAAKLGLWVARPLEQPGSRPLRFEFTQDVGSRLVEWPVTHTIKCLAFYHPDDPAELKAEQAQKLLTLHRAARKLGRELLIEIIAGKHGAMADDTVARVLEELYGLGIKPDWWKLEPQASSRAWDRIGAMIARHDPYCRGIMLLGLEAPEAELDKAFRATAGHKAVKGFAIGRSIFGEVAPSWLAGKTSDDAATAEMAERFASLVKLWNTAHEKRAA
jgi:5-dehydro-2-deoxygluconokinase